EYQYLKQNKEAVSYFERSLKVREKIYGPDDLKLADTLDSLAMLNKELGNYQQAAAQYQREAKINEKQLGPADPQLAETLNSLGLVEVEIAKYDDAVKALKQALAIREKALGPSDPLTGQSEHNLAGAYASADDYQAALTHLQRAQKIWEKAYGIEHANTAACYCTFGDVYRSLGNFSQAISFYRKSLTIREKLLGPESEEVAQTLNNLGLLYQDQGDLDNAESAFLRALKIAEKSTELENHKTATYLHNLASVYADRGDRAKAIAMDERALAIYEKVYGPEHPDVAAALSNLAETYRKQHQYDAALPLGRRALAIREKIDGPESRDAALSLNNVGLILLGQGKFSEAEPLFQRAVKISEKTLPADHPDYALQIDNLASLYLAMGKYEQAMPLIERAAEPAMHRLELASSAQSERQQLLAIKESRFFLDNQISCALSVLEHAPRSTKGAQSAGDLIDRAYAKTLLWKGSVLMRQRMQRLARQAGNASQQELWSQLAAVSTRIANASLQSSSAVENGDLRDSVAKLMEEKESLEARLSSTSAEFRNVRQQQNITPSEIAQLLPAGTALVDLLQIERRTDELPKGGPLKTTWTDHYVAFVATHDRPLKLLDLGPVEPIDAAVAAWRAVRCGQVGGAEADKQPSVVLRRLIFEPLSKHLTGITTILVSPDGSLNQIPWSALPGSKPGTYLLEDFGIATLPAPQLLADLMKPAGEADSAKGKAATGSSPSILLIGDVDYDAAPRNSQPKAVPVPKQPPNSQQPPISALADADRTAALGVAIPKFQRLKGTGVEIARIGTLYRSRFGSQPDVRTLAAASEQAVREEAPKHRYLHFATHGFFAPAAVASATKIEPSRNGDAAPDQSLHSIVGFNLGLLSGLVFAGANRRNETRGSSAQAGGQTQTTGQAPAAAQLPGDDGILTALEVGTLDLRNVDLAVLSACETGLGETAGGEGTLGLQRAFQVAGAKSTITSLWGIDDAATQTLMVEFYKRLWDKDQPLSKLEALRQAQLAMLHDQIRGIDFEKNAGDFSDTLAPKYWAGFVLSGDWR
ncbi:MAG TPA: CHAT domain-containing tetratricopeptide repeat protein, partial [Pirellulales bacterium]